MTMHVVNPNGGGEKDELPININDVHARCLSHYAKCTLCIALRLTLGTIEERNIE